MSTSYGIKIEKGIVIESAVLKNLDIGAYPDYDMILVEYNGHHEYGFGTVYDVMVKDGNLNDKNFFGSWSIKKFETGVSTNGYAECSECIIEDPFGDTETFQFQRRNPEDVLQCALQFASTYASVREKTMLEDDLAEQLDSSSEVTSEKLQELFCKVRNFNEVYESIKNSGRENLTESQKKTREKLAKKRDLIVRRFLSLNLKKEEN